MGQRKCGAQPTAPEKLQDFKEAVGTTHGKGDIAVTISNRLAHGKAFRVNCGHEGLK
ncbi:MAG: hypothetical protein ACK5V0_10885 [Alphaproteobacteria bacterium]